VLNPKPKEFAMGFVYAWNRIRDGRIPRSEAFRELCEEFTSLMRACPAVLTGAVFGSATREDVTGRSDLDLFLVYDVERQDEARRLLRRMRRKAAACHVVLNLRCHTAQKAWSGDHRFGPSYRSTWKRLSELGLLKGDPGSFYRSFARETVRDEMSRKISRYLRKTRLLHERYERTRGRPGWLEGFLEQARSQNIRPAHLHISLSRILLLWRNGRLLDDRKAVVVDRALSESDLESLHEDIRAARDLDEQYDALLAKAIAESVGKSTYEREVRRLLSELMAVNLRLALHAHDIVSAGRQNVRDAA